MCRCSAVQWYDFYLTYKRKTNFLHGILISVHMFQIIKGSLRFLFRNIWKCFIKAHGMDQRDIAGPCSYHGRVLGRGKKSWRCAKSGQKFQANRTGWEGTKLMDSCSCIIQSHFCHCLLSGLFKSRQMAFRSCFNPVTLAKPHVLANLLKAIRNSQHQAGACISAY